MKIELKSIEINSNEETDKNFKRLVFSVTEANIVDYHNLRQCFNYNIYCPSEFMDVMSEFVNKYYLCLILNFVNATENSFDIVLFDIDIKKIKLNTKIINVLNKYIKTKYNN